MEADLDGSQRKVLASRVRPTKTAHGTEGIPLRDGKTLPFEVARSWSAPAGYYPEQWFLVHPTTREVMYESPVVTRRIFGLQSATEVTDAVEEPLELLPGGYQIVFALGGLKGGEAQVVVREESASAA
ncbi:MAG: hypothetical protein KY391_01625 [Actinobacteria bacterium]|nr:hypothetical protein [Actinomycetota bacterium]